MERGRIEGLPKFFPIISGMDKATNFKFCRTFLVSIGTKALYKFREK